jgi:hypothetical protein
VGTVITVRYRAPPDRVRLWSAWLIDAGLDTLFVGWDSSVKTFCRGWLELARDPQTCAPASEVGAQRPHGFSLMDLCARETKAPFTVERVAA